MISIFHENLLIQHGVKKSVAGCARLRHWSPATGRREREKPVGKVDLEANLRFTHDSIDHYYIQTDFQ